MSLASKRFILTSVLEPTGIVRFFRVLKCFPPVRVILSDLLIDFDCTIEVEDSPMSDAVKSVLKLRVRGPGIGKGRIPVPDLIKICQEAQSAVKKQAEAMEGRKTIHPGPVAAAILEECTLELIKVGKGSTTLEFAFAKPQTRIAEMEALALGAQAISEVVASIKSLGNGNRKSIDPGVLQSVYSLSGMVAEGKRVNRIDWSAPGQGGRRVAASVNSTVRERAALRLSSPRYMPGHVDGVLEMADFKTEDYKCRIDPAIGSPVICTFGPDLADRIQQLLRTTVRGSGRAKYPAHAEKIELLDLQTIDPLPSLSSGGEHFFKDSPLGRLADMQRVKPLDPAKLAGAIPADADVDAFLEEIYSARK